MKSVTFKSLKIQNFLSIGNDPVCIYFKQGINLITGQNKDKPDRRNAIGKSTIADGLYFAIFGEPLREIKKDLIVNNITGGTTIIELEFDVKTPTSEHTYTICRKNNPSKITISKDDVDVTRDTIANTNKYICDVLSATPAVFQNCVIMTVNGAIPFMAKNKTEKRKFIEDIFGLEVFSKMISELRNEINQVTKENEIEQTKFDEVNRSVFNYQKQKEKTLDHRKNKHATYLQRQGENEENIAKLEQKRDSMVFWDEQIVKETVSKIDTGINKCDSNINELTLKSGELVSKIKTCKNTLVKIGTDEDKCPVCLRSIEDHDTAYIEAEKNKIKEEISNLVLQQTELQTNLIEYQRKRNLLSVKLKEEEGKLSKNKLLNQEERNIQDKIDQLVKWQDSLIEDIKQVETTTTEFDELIVKTELRCDELDKIITDKRQQLQKLEVVKYIISEEGVKSYIVNKLLELLNGKLMFYLKKLDSNAVCYFNEFFEEEIVNEKNKICSYFNFSGAERKSVDLACLFTFSDLRRMQGGVQYNIAFYDELFDSSFDDKGIELIVDLLKERSEQYKECIYVISHRPESLKAVTGEIVYLEKQSGITKRVDFANE